MTTDRQPVCDADGEWVDCADGGATVYRNILTKCADRRQEWRACGNPIKCIVRFSQNDYLEEPAAHGGGDRG
jgi:hypothetical protein